MASNGLGLVRTSPDIGELQKLLPSFSGLFNSTKGYRDSVVGSRTIMKEGRAVNVSQNTNRAYESVIAVLDRLVDDAEGVLEYAIDAESVIQQRTAKGNSG